MSNLRNRLNGMDKESALELHDSFAGENTESELKKLLTHTIVIEPVSIEGHISDFNMDLEIKMSNGDKITYQYVDNGAGGPMNVRKCKMTINGVDVGADPDESFMDEIMSKYKYHLEN